jgi:hypothetical protein
MPQIRVAQAYQQECDEKGQAQAFNAQEIFSFLAQFRANRLKWKWR